MSLVRIEIRRALHRRAVRVLIAIAVVGCAAAGVIAFIDSSGKSELEMRLDEGHPAIMTHWWIADTNDGFLSIAMLFLFMGAFFGGATVAGGEWRAGTVTTVLTWEPRRVRLHVARSTSSAVLALGISFALQVLFLAAVVPAVAINGTADGADWSFWNALAIAMVRTSVIAAVAAVLAIALATIGRNTAFAVIAMFAWLVVAEGLIRSLKPSLARWLWGENVGSVMSWGKLETAAARGPVVAALTLCVYVTVIASFATLAFQRRDIAAPA